MDDNIDYIDNIDGFNDNYILQYSNNEWNLIPENVCYICLESEKEEPNKILYKSNCKCKNLYYHKDCSNKLLKKMNINHCSICKDIIKKKPIKDTKYRYNFCLLCDIFF